MQLETATRTGPTFICLAPGSWQNLGEQITPVPVGRELALRPTTRRDKRSYRLALEIPLVRLFVALVVLILNIRAAAQEHAGRLSIARVVIRVALVVIYTDAAYTLIGPAVNVTFQGGIA